MVSKLLLVVGRDAREGEHRLQCLARQDPTAARKLAGQKRAHVRLRDWTHFMERRRLIEVTSFAGKESSIEARALPANT